MNIQKWIESGKPMNNIIHGDCMDIMKDIPDKFFELAIVDPPYGIGFDREYKSMVKEYPKNYKLNDWDVKPNKEYFDELFRISKNQIIWGGNYFDLKQSSGWIFWDKLKPENFTLAPGELAWTSFDKSVRKFTFQYHGFICEKKENRFHPTQKPIALYRWLLQNYAKPGDKIIDTHSGSGSCAIACHLEKYDFIAIEKDPEYHALSVKRLEELRSQGVLF